jgi:hypothetical protein
VRLSVRRAESCTGPGLYTKGEEDPEILARAGNATTAPGTAEKSDNIIPVLPVVNWVAISSLSFLREVPSSSETSASDVVRLKVQKSSDILSGEGE